GAKMILDWDDAMMKTSRYDVDPMWTVMREGGPEHCRGQLKDYMKRAVAVGFHDNVELLPTVQELLQTSNVSKRYHYDGVSFAETLRNGKDCSK
ncbi:hypothetical protein RA263_27940, partial [Pseudomonas syringae pv. tagetis]|uniref:hypothetical protein n=1 Tax=Pseudomonas syringae group genomosp. 7 TaxID=251699 RepID=UPI00377059D2